MCRRCLAPAVLSFGLLACAGAHPQQVPASLASAPRDRALAAELRAAIDAEVRLGFSGQVLVARHGVALVDGAFGALGERAVGASDHFLIASVAKQFTSALLLRMQDRGELDIGDPITRFLPDVPPDKRRITIAQLLSHTSGLGQGYESERARDWQQAARTILALPLAAAPGTLFQYSNENYQLAVALVESITHRPYADVVRQELLLPVGLRDTGQISGPADIARLAPTADPLPPRLREFSWGGFGWFSTARDLYRWYEALRGGRVLRPRSLSLLFAPVARTTEGQAALGWFVATTSHGAPVVYTRGNDDSGQNGLIYAYPDQDLVIVVLTHAGDRSDGVSHSRALQAILEALLL